MRDACQGLIAIYGPSLVKGFLTRENADVICHALPFCNHSPQCHLNPLTKKLKNLQGFAKHSETYKASSPLALDPEFATKMYKTLWDVVEQGKKDYQNKKIEEHIDLMNSQQGFTSNNLNGFKKSSLNTDVSHLPFVDLDGDRFSTYPDLRGTKWRGKDCADIDSYKYPGRRTNPYGNNQDYNCNGIFGTHPSGSFWKDYVCSNTTSPRGVAVIGDSAGAHFSIPPSWVTPADVHWETYSNFWPVLSNEFDIPAASAYTAYLPNNSSFVYPLRSLYKTLRERNHCNHRDYQNIAVNGGDSYNVQEYLKAVARDQKHDYPMLMVLELLGNDVCSREHSFQSMTPPSVFKSNILKIMSQLDAILPQGSHLLILGLVDGRNLFDILHNKIHPLGGNITYTDLYDFLNCVHLNPCWGWLNSNATVRNLTTDHANLLNAQYVAIVNETRGMWKNFDVQYYDLPATEIINSWASHGYDKSLLIEPVDGFHPSQYLLSVLSDWVVARLEIDNPSFLGPINPANPLIEAVFGDQGGY